MGVRIPKNANRDFAGQSTYDVGMLIILSIPKP